MEVICLEDAAFYSLVEQVFERLKDKEKAKEDKWISVDEAMQKLRISSKTTLQKLRDEGKIRFSQPEKNHIIVNPKLISPHHISAIKMIENFLNLLSIIKKIMETISCDYRLTIL